MNEQEINKLQCATRERIKKFNSLRGEVVQPREFWNVVVVTAADENQKESFELQIAEKIYRKELPLGVTYKIFSDPPGPKIGNGGSSMYALQQLDKIYGKRLSEIRVILIHAGGFSQRLPNASALGKIFAAMPLGEPLYQMLELKLAAYVDFPGRMAPGVLVTCADDIEVYSAGDGDGGVRFDKPGFTALAHPSPLSVGTGHGVFVLEPASPAATAAGSTEAAVNVPCHHFLHKPSVAEMRAHGAVCRRPRGEEFVYTDSAYYVDHATAMTLVGLLDAIGPLDCEVDAYGDFLRALGPGATAAHADQEGGGRAAEVRREIFARLRGTPLTVVLLDHSRFYHIGTVPEYLRHLTAADAAARRELGLLSSAFSVSLDHGGGESLAQCPAENPTIPAWSCKQNPAQNSAEKPAEIPMKNPAGSPAPSSSVSCVMHSVLGPGCSVSPSTVVEYCRLEAGATVGRGSVLSGCWVSPGLSVPAGVLMHSLCVRRHRGAHAAGYVTVFFGTGDDVKRGVASASSSDTHALELLGLALPDCLPRWNLGNGVLGFSVDGSECSLWSARVFPVCADRTSSFSASLGMVRALLGGPPHTLPQGTAMISMRDALQRKDLREMLAFRRGLYDDIVRSRRTH